MINYDERNILTLRSYPVNDLMLNSIDTISIVKGGVMGSVVGWDCKEIAYELLIDNKAIVN